MFTTQMEPAGLPCLLLLFTSPGTLTFPLPKVISQHYVDYGDLDDGDNDTNHYQLWQLRPYCKEEGYWKG